MMKLSCHFYLSTCPVWCDTEIQKQMSMMKNGLGGLSVFVGLNGTKEELGLKADNYWIFAENNIDELYVVFASRICCLCCGQTRPGSVFVLQSQPVHLLKRFDML